MIRGVLKVLRGVVRVIFPEFIASFSISLGLFVFFKNVVALSEKNYAQTVFQSY